MRLANVSLAFHTMPKMYMEQKSLRKPFLLFHKMLPQFLSTMMKVIQPVLLSIRPFKEYIKFIDKTLEKQNRFNK